MDGSQLLVARREERGGGGQGVEIPAAEVAVDSAPLFPGLAPLALRLWDG